jgi:D-alanine-D-alanine ligase
MEGIKNIAIIYGGSSAEREVSIESGEGIFNALSKMGIKSTLIEYADFEQISLDNFDLVFIALHGHEGESGELQKVLSERNIKYTGSSLKGCSQTWNKRICKEILLENNIGTPKWISVSNLETDLKSTSAEELYQKIKSEMGEEIFMKPSEDGSSIDIFKIESKSSFMNAINDCINLNREFIFEEAINGKEITVGIINNKCLPPVEIKTNNIFYNYEAKYLSNETSLIEANLSEEKKEEIQQMALNAFHACGCKSWARVDFLQDNNGNFFVIEINTAPGMTSHSLVPKAGSFLGLSYEEVLKNIINASL